MADLIVMHTVSEMGHLVSMFELAKLILLHHRPSRLSLSISVLLASDIPSNAVSSFISDASSVTPSITFHHVPAPPPPETFPPPDFSPFDMIRINNPNLRRTLLTISHNDPNRIKAFIVDFLCIDATEVSNELGIPTYGFFTSSAHALASLLYAPTLHRITTKSLKDLDSYLDIPGNPRIHSSDMPTTLMDRESKTYNFFLRTAVTMFKHVGIVVNSFNSMEESAIRAIRDGLCVTDGPTPPLFCVGPLVGDTGDGGDHGKNEKHGGCLKWLDSQPKKSVVFLCFGSLGSFSAEQLTEIAIGLEKSAVRFLWVVRNPITEEDELRRMLPADEPDLDSFLPEGFLERTKEKGLVVKNWAPQVEVLSHDSVGGFVTHCGWNSLLESVCAGVPTVAWPLYREQRMNRVFLVEELNLGLGLNELENGFVEADEWADRVSELMDPGRGKAVKQRVMEMKEGAVAAMKEGGSSFVDLANFVGSLRLGE